MSGKENKEEDNMRELKQRTLSLVLALMMAGTALTPAFAQEQTGEGSGTTDIILPPPVLFPPRAMR